MAQQEVKQIKAGDVFVAKYPFIIESDRTAVGDIVIAVSDVLIEHEDTTRILPWQILYFMSNGNLIKFRTSGDMLEHVTHYLVHVE
jgi:hypothetical protein